MSIRSDGVWLTADYWFADFIEKLQQSGVRGVRLIREAVVMPDEDRAARDYEIETEQMRRVIAVERERWLAEQEKRA